MPQCVAIRDLMADVLLMPAQTLHGYARGHRLLAVGGDVAESEVDVLDHLSDLSGYLPANTSFDAYHTGFPCGRYYALACTWPDDGAPRRGTVLTHTLLIPRQHWLAKPDPFSWLAAHRRPADARDTAAYAAPLIEPAPGDQPATHPEPELRGLLRLWFGQSERPLLWLDEHPPLTVVRALWPWLWTELRATFTFCTFALQPRIFRGRPFDFLGVPPQAIGSFHELSASPAWWRQHDALDDSDPWLHDLLARGPGAIDALVDRCRTEGLGPPASAGLFRAAQRYWELAEGARTRLPAARARLDMLTRVWPSVALEHPAVVAAVEHLLARQGDAPLEPRPLWDLEHLLTSPPVRAHIIQRTELGARILACVVDQLERRLRRAGEPIADRLAVLYTAAPDAARSAIGTAIEAVGPEAVDAWAEPMLDLAAETADVSLEQSLWACLPVATLTRWIARQIAERDDLVAFLRDRVATLAIRRKSPELAFAAWADDESRGLAAAAAVVSGAPATTADFEALLRRQPELAQLEWCLDCDVEPLRELAARRGADLLSTRNLSASALAARCDTRPLGAQIFARACPWTADHELTVLFERHPALIRDLVHVALAEPYLSPSSISTAALRLAPAALLWTPTARAALVRRPVFAGDTSRHILVERLLGQLATDPLDPDEAGAWLALPFLATWLHTASTWDLERPFLSRWSDALGRTLAATTCARAHSNHPGVFRPLALVVSHTWSDVLDHYLCGLLGLLAASTPGEPGESGDLLLRAELLGTLSRSARPRHWQLAEACFYPVYRAILAGTPALRQASWWMRVPTDAAKFWRHWLLDIWCEHGWPPAAFLSCLRSDRALAERVFKRAAGHSRATRAWLLSLEPELRREPAFAGLWREALRD